MQETNKNHVKKLVKRAADAETASDAMMFAQAASFAADALYNVDNMAIETKPAPPAKPEAEKQT